MKNFSRCDDFAHKYAMPGGETPQRTYVGAPPPTHAQAWHSSSTLQSPWLRRWVAATSFTSPVHPISSHSGPAPPCPALPGAVNFYVRPSRNHVLPTIQPRRAVRMSFSLRVQRTLPFNLHSTLHSPGGYSLFPSGFRYTFRSLFIPVTKRFFFLFLIHNFFSSLFFFFEIQTFFFFVGKNL